MEVMNWGMHGLCYCYEKPADINSKIILLNNIVWAQILHAFVSSLSHAHTLPNNFSYVHNLQRYQLNSLFTPLLYDLGKTQKILLWYLS